MFGKDLGIPARFFTELLPRIREISGVISAGVVSVLPGANDMPYGYDVADRPATPRPAPFRWRICATPTPATFAPCRFPS